MVKKVDHWTTGAETSATTGIECFQRPRMTRPRTSGLGLAALLCMLVLPVGGEICGDAVCSYRFVVRRARTMTHTRTVQGWEQNNQVSITNDGHLELFTTLTLDSNRDDVNGTRVSADDVITADGVQRNVILVNGQFPGPAIEVMEGAQVAVTVVNQLMTDAITIHWHGLHMRNTPWMDGVPSVTQCPITPHESFTYRFRAFPAGTFYYHSHMSRQMADGLFGALIIHNSQTTIPSFPLLLNDWYHEEAETLDIASKYNLYHRGAGQFERAEPSRGYSVDGIEIAVRQFVSALINGRGRYKSNKAPLSKFTVEEAQKIRIRLIHAGGDHNFKVSIDQHALRVLASDGHDINPLTVDAIIVSPGERYDFEVDASASPGLYWVRAETLREGTCVTCSSENITLTPDDIVEDSRAVLVYQGSSSDEDPTSQARQCTPENPCIFLNCPFEGYPEDRQIVCISIANTSNPTSAQDYAAEDEDVEEYFLNFGFEVGTNINGHRFLPPTAPLYQSPRTNMIIPCPLENCQQGCKCTHILDLPFNKTIQFVLASYQNSRFANSHHNIHVHGYTFDVVAMGYASFDRITGVFKDSNPDVVCSNKRCTTVTWRQGSPSFNIKNAPQKDTVLMPAHGYTVVRFRSDNPGFWFLHCHQSMHLAEGMAMVLNVAADRHPAPPSGFPKCGNFSWSEEEYEAAVSGVWPPNQKEPARHETWELVVAVLGSAAGGAAVATGLMMWLQKRRNSNSN
ncbi:Hypp1020 [Branchiostoma lanceolatum]|uniref:ferroxidase n=1 Tax=Branchiostoma lanceolatum TaxID=7740 RepID=A0A8J9ZDY6_BRALA|nr:Hypp1020 [Branchiostoma lanceolatum]